MQLVVAHHGDVRRDVDGHVVVLHGVGRNGGTFFRLAILLHRKLVQSQAAQHAQHPFGQRVALVDFVDDIVFGQAWGIVADLLHVAF